jgi:hypothetical protein
VFVRARCRPDQLRAAGTVASVKVVFVKLSDQRHTVRVERSDGSSESVELDSRSFLRHDLAHLAVELELGLFAGVWGSVARGGSLSGGGLDGADMPLAETLSGPMQTMMRTGANATEIHEVLARMAPGVVSPDLATRLHAHVRSLAGHWAATPYGGEMVLEWPEGPVTRR